MVTEPLDAAAACAAGAVPPADAVVAATAAESRPTATTPRERLSSAFISCPSLDPVIDYRLAAGGAYTCFVRDSEGSRATAGAGGTRRCLGTPSLGRAEDQACPLGRGTTAVPAARHTLRPAS